MAVMEAIATTYLEVDATSVTFSSLGSYEHLQLRISAKSDRSASYANDDIKLNLNGDTGSNYSYRRMMGSEAGASADRTSSGSYIKVSSVQSDAGLSGAENYGAVIIDILDYRNGSKNTTVAGTGGLNRIFSALVGAARAVLFSGMWNNTAAVTSIVLAPAGSSNFVRGSEFTLYGLNSS